MFIDTGYIIQRVVIHDPRHSAARAKFNAYLCIAMTWKDAQNIFLTRKAAE